MVTGPLFFFSRAGLCVCILNLPTGPVSSSSTRPAGVWRGRLLRRRCPQSRHSSPCSSPLQRFAWPPISWPSVAVLCCQRGPRRRAGRGVVVETGASLKYSCTPHLHPTPFSCARRLRDLLADFAPTLGVAAGCLAAAAARRRWGVGLPSLAVPEALATTTGRPWLVDLGALPPWARLAAAVPALMVRAVADFLVKS